MRPNDIQKSFLNFSKLGVFFKFTKENGLD